MTCDRNFELNSKIASCDFDKSITQKNHLKATCVIYYLFITLINCDFDVNSLWDNLVNLRNFDNRRNTRERAYVCVCSLEVEKVRESYKHYFYPLNSSTDFIKLFNFNTSQFKCIDCNYFMINNLISIIFIFNFKLFRQLRSISCSMASCVKCHCVQGRICKVCEKGRKDAIGVSFGALKCSSATNDKVCNLTVAQRHFSGPVSHFGFPIVLSKKICFTVISYVYYNFIIKNVIPKIGLKFLHTSVIVMPFYLIFYPLSGFYSNLSFGNSYYSHSFPNGRMFLL